MVTLLISHFVQPRYPEPEKLTTYECGSEPFSDARMPFPVRYYIFAMLFVIFDIEVIFLYPWAVVFKKIGIIGLSRNDDLYRPFRRGLRLCLAKRRTGVGLRTVWD